MARARRMSGAGNRFIVTDADAGEVDGWLAVLASEADPVDGLLQVRAGAPELASGELPATPDSEERELGPVDCTLTIFNADGSHAEACGNGLRCAALFAHEYGFARASGASGLGSRSEWVIATAAGPRRVALELRAEGSHHARAELGPVRASVVRLETSGGVLAAVAADVGNPHCVVFVHELEGERLRELGRELQGHPSFPDGVNLELVKVEAGRLVVRVFERGVGETAACGTGACAAVAAATLVYGAGAPTRVSMPGGELAVEVDDSGVHWLSGPVEFSDAPQ